MRWTSGACPGEWGCASVAAGGALCACVSAEHPVGLMLLPMCTFHPVWRFFFRISGPQRAASSVTSQLLSPSEPMWLCAIGPGGWSQAPGPAAGLGLGPVLPAPDGPRFLKMGEVKATLLFLRCATKHFFFRGEHFDRGETRCFSFIFCLQISGPDELSWDGVSTGVRTLPVVGSGVGQDYLVPGPALLPGVITTSNIPAKGFPVDWVPCSRF